MRRPYPLLPFVCAALCPIAGVGLAQASSAKRIEALVVDKEGKTAARALAPMPNNAAYLRMRREFRPGDRVVVTGPAEMEIRVARMRSAIVYCPGGRWEFPIPFGRAARAYPSFAGSLHTVSARAPTPAQRARRGNLAANPYDRADVADTFPHATTNSVCRNDPVFAARNAIDGESQTKGHGAWPHQSWGPDQKQGLWWKLDFGREVDLVSIDVWLRADLPHDAFFASAAVEFSDGSTAGLALKPSAGKQIFRVGQRRVSWLKLTHLALPQAKGWSAITEVGAWGRTASDYAKGRDWSDTLAKQLWRDPLYVVARATLDFPDTRERLEIISDWLQQDGLVARKPAWGSAIAKGLQELGEQGGSLRGKLAAVVTAQTEDPRWAALYLEVCHQRRSARLAAHRAQLRRVLFAKHFDMGGSHYAYTEAQSDAQHECHFRPGASLCVLDMDGPYGKVADLVADPKGVIRDPALSHDARRVLFAWKKDRTKDDYHLYEHSLDTGQTRQITRGLGAADYEAAYLPNGDIVFNSTRCVQTVDCWWTEVSNLYTCDPDGLYLRRLSFDQVHTNYPTMTPDGRVIYTRWEYSDRGQIYPQGLFQMNPDGTAQTELYGNNSFFPTAILHARQIPGSRKIACIFSGHHTRQNGWLGTIDPGMGRQENSGAQLIAPVRDTPAVHVDRYGQTGDQFQYPYPLSETAFLVGMKPVGESRFSIYFVTADGRRERLASDVRTSCSQPAPLAPRPRPHVRPSLADYTQHEGTIYMQDVYHGPGLAGVPRGAIKALRVVAIHYRAAGVGSNSNRGPAGGALVSTPVSINGTWDTKTILGTATVHQDGSACFDVPARQPLYFQALDAQGHAVQSMRSWVTLQPQEHVSCVGCHEDKNTAPPQQRATMAMRAGPQRLAPDVAADHPFSFVRDVQPILDRHCVRCHHGRGKPPYTQPHNGRTFDPKGMRNVVPCEGATWRYTERPPAAGWMQPGFDDASWSAGKGGFGRKGTPGARIGTPWHSKTIWLRRTFSLPAQTRLTDPMFLVHHDEDVQIYLNGVLAATATGYTRRYELLPMTAKGKVAMKSAQNTLAVHCTQTYGGQFIDVGVVDEFGSPGPAHPPEASQPAFSLQDRRTFDARSLRKWSDSYKALARRGIASWISPQSAPPMLPAYHAGAAKSRLISLLQEGHNGAKLTSVEMRAIAAWIDLLVPYCGEYTEGLEGKHLAKYQHFAAKRQRLAAAEAQAIAALIEARP